MAAAQFSGANRKKESPRCSLSANRSGRSASVRVRAADSIFSHAARAIEIEDIEARSSELERAAEASQSVIGFT